MVSKMATKRGSENWVDAALVVIRETLPCQRSLPVFSLNPLFQLCSDAYRPSGLVSGWDRDGPSRSRHDAIPLVTSPHEIPIRAGSSARCGCDGRNHDHLRRGATVPA